MIDGSFFQETTGTLKAIGQDRVLQTDVNDLIEVSQDRIEFSGEIEPGGQIKADATRDNSAAQEAIAGQRFVQAQQLLAQTPTSSVGDREAGIVGDRAEVGDVIVATLQLEQDDSQITRP